MGHLGEARTPVRSLPSLLVGSCRKPRSRAPSEMRQQAQNRSPSIVIPDRAQRASGTQRQWRGPSPWPWVPALGLTPSAGMTNVRAWPRPFTCRPLGRLGQTPAKAGGRPNIVRCSLPCVGSSLTLDPTYDSPVILVRVPRPSSLCDQACAETAPASGWLGDLGARLRGHDVSCKQPPVQLASFPRRREPSPRGNEGVGSSWLGVGCPSQVVSELGQTSRTARDHTLSTADARAR